MAMKASIALLISFSLTLSHSTAFQPPVQPNFHVCRRATNNAHLQATIDNNVLSQLAIAGTLGLVADSVVSRTEIAENLYSERPTLEQEFNPRLVIFHGVADSLSNAAWVYFALTLIAAISDFLDLTYFDSDQLFQSAPTVAITIWGALALSTTKRSIFLQKVSGTKLGRVRLYDQLIDFIIFFVTASFVVDELQLEESLGMGVKSIFAASGIGALFFSLASKSLAENIIGGITLQAWDAISVGDDVRLGDGTEGTIVSIGLVDTQIAGFDNIITRIPNSQIVNERVSNISRTKRSQVKQILRFSYGDIDKVPKVLSDIKEEITGSCPMLVTDGSKPFAAVLSQYEPDHIQTTVDCHFDIQPGTNEYRMNKEEVLLAIARAIQKNNVSFAIPAINYVEDTKSEE